MKRKVILSAVIIVSLICSVFLLTACVPSDWDIEQAFEDAGYTVEWLDKELTREEANYRVLWSMIVRNGEEFAHIVAFSRIDVYRVAWEARRDDIFIIFPWESDEEYARRGNIIAHGTSGALEIFLNT